RIVMLFVRAESCRTNENEKKQDRDDKTHILFRGWKFEDRVINRNVGFCFVDDDFLFVWSAFAAGLNGKRKKDAGNFFVVAHIGLYLHLCTLLHPLRSLTNFQESIVIEINRSYVAVLANHFELVRQGAVDVFRAE